MRQFSVTTHNINHDGYPSVPNTHVPGFVLTQETNEIHVRSRLPQYRHLFDDYEHLPSGLSTSWSRKSGIAKIDWAIKSFRDDVEEKNPLPPTGALRLHRSGRGLGLMGIRTPARSLQNHLFQVGNHKVVVANTHLINSAFPLGGPDRFTATRRKLWELSWGKILEWEQDWHEAGFLVVLAGDLNRMRPPASIPDMQRVSPDGSLDHIYVTKDAFRVEQILHGERTGSAGKVHHRSLQIILEFKHD